MSGYTPVFRSVFTGTLCGKWPDTAAWLCLLALADKNGVIDMTPQYISSVTGMPTHDLLACIGRFMQPDEFSRSQESDGRRLVLVDPQRSWGWRIVNFAHYREKARLMAKNEREVQSGSNKERLTAAHRRSPPVTAADPLSDSNADTDSNTEKKPPALRSGGAGGRPKKSSTVPEGFVLTPERRSWAEGVNPQLDVDAEFAKFTEHEFRDPHSDWDRAWKRWVRTGLKRGDFARRASSAPMMFAGKPVEWQ